MSQIKDCGNPIDPPAIATDGNDSYSKAMIETWGKAPSYCGRGRPPTRKRPQPDWKCIQVVKHRSGDGLLMSLTKWSLAIQKMSVI
jgi:hypothetical protein